MGGVVNGVFVVLLVINSCSPTTTELREQIRSGEFRRACSTSVNIVQPPNRVNTTQKLADLRNLMLNTSFTRDQRLLDAYIVPSQDEHQNEFVEDYDKRLQFISGFSGSYGYAVITAKSAILWTDGRYHLQADNETDCNWKLMRQHIYYVPNISQWLRESRPQGGVIGADPKLFSQSKWEEFSVSLRDVKWELIEIQTDLIDVIWTNRPARRNKNAFILDEKYTGRKWTRKIHNLRKTVQKLQADAIVVTSLDEIGWLLNIRGRDIPSSPLVRSYLLLDMERVWLYVNQSQLEANHVAESLTNSAKEANQLIEFFDYEQICTGLASRAQLYSRILLPPESTSRRIAQCVPPRKRLFVQSPIILFKARKNPIEIKGMHHAHVRDAASMCEFFAYLDKMFKEGLPFTELDIVKVVDEFRFEQLNSLGNSFPTIAAYGANGAMPHYVPMGSTNVMVGNDSTLVLDSGGQYFDGTTDITRTVHFGTPTKEQKEAYTRVLIGQIQLSMLTFPAYLKTSAIDVMARAPLWEVGLDYDHGTSHGVGSFLNVHEAPISLHFNNPSSTFPENDILKPGYFLSNEPGYYQENDFGIRLENVMEVIDKKWLRSIHGTSYLGFKTVTLVPYEPKLIDLSLLSRHQIQWLNQYNDRIRIHVGAELKKQNFTKGFFWMMEQTKHFPENGNKYHKIHPIVVILAAILISWM
ncbi:xaa-Pro aminopeptidase ApepP-like isoform X1 [Tribolium madens]|uniref:xaa-Pro aminopeptidase ApepP-like isoform X1 n=1 Tax=Tribolium madens TaxID=41895 RepID=UPI001CF745DE|nr:xaa-Pro aminopeptidase ApepP-like isoform X1 [Tribolium madens]